MSSAPQPWTVASTVERADLDPVGKASVTFTVVNQGPTDELLVLDLVSDEGTAGKWFQVDEPRVPVPHGGSLSVLVTLTVPAGTPPGRHWFAARVHSAGTALEEDSVLSDRVTFDIAERAKTSTLPKWVIPVVVIILLLVVIGGVVFFLTRSDESTTDPVSVSDVVVESRSAAEAPSGAADLKVVVTVGAVAAPGNVTKPTREAGATVKAWSTVTLTVDLDQYAINNRLGAQSAGELAQKLLALIQRLAPNGPAVVEREVDLSGPEAAILSGGGVR